LLEENAMIRTTALACSLLAFAATGVAAQTTMPMSASSTMSPMHMQRMHGAPNVKGMHRMPATVTSTDPSSGLVKVTSAGMALVVHFPPPAMKGLKPGDKITLHLGYSQP